MNKWVLFILFHFFLQLANAQFTITLRITSLPPYHHVADPIFLAGSFNNWNPGQNRFQFEKESSGTYIISLLMPAGKYEYKLTRGSWDKVECGEEGYPTQNRTIEVSSDTAIHLSVKHWGDHFPKNEKRNTANRNVKILDTAFYIPQLNRYRRVWIYLPSSYATSNKKYPVLYMHDGQNVFDEATSYAGEWGVDEALDTLERTAGECMVVAIDHGGEKRINEYSPFNMERYGKGEGVLYTDFVAKTLRKFIDRKYRTKRSRNDRFIAGSSMGGLISLYAILKYPKVFGGAGVFSPAFWVAPAINDVAAAKGRKVKGKIYFHAGMLESKSMVPDMLRIFKTMYKVSAAKMTSVIRSSGQHTEAAWRQEFPHFYKWIRE